MYVLEDENQYLSFYFKKFKSKQQIELKESRRKRVKRKKWNRKQMQNIKSTKPHIRFLKSIKSGKPKLIKERKKEITNIRNETDDIISDP